MWKSYGNRLFWMCLLLIISLPLQAQDNPSPDDIALQRIENAAAIEVRRLDLSGLGLTDVPSQIGQLVSMRSINLDNNNLTLIPPEIFLLPTLEVVTIRENQLTEISAEIRKLTNLDYLDVSRNQLQSLPSSMGDLQELSTLILDFNQLTTLPASIGNLQDLCFLSVNDNYLQHLPLTFGQLERLGRTDLHCNGGDTAIRVMRNPSLVNPSAEVVRAGSFAIIAELRYQQNLRRNSIQWLLLGFAGGLGFALLLRLIFRLKSRSSCKPKE